MRKQKLVARTDIKVRKRKLRENLRPPPLDIAAGESIEAIASTADKHVASNGLATLQRAIGTSSPGHRLGSAPIVNVRRTVRRTQLREIVPLADTTIYEMEQRGEFPRRFYLTPRCVVWDLGEVEASVVARREASDATNITRAPTPDVRRRRTRPVTR